MRWIIRINNWLLWRFKKKVTADQMLVLLPHCLQFSPCQCDIVADVQNCKRCGKCAIAAVADLCKERGVYAFIANGGRLAVAEVKRRNPRCIIAVACVKELFLGLCAVFPYAVYTVQNATPNGPCKDTMVDVDTVSEAMNRFLAK